MWTVLAALLAGGIAWLILSPFRFPVAVVDGSQGDTDRVRVRLLDTKELAVRAVKDLENDYAMGKVNQEEYDRSFAQLSRDVAVALEEIKRYERG